jgi:tRNA threonylcarbamoyladenosine biosynthesis protein TsaB
LITIIIDTSTEKSLIALTDGANLLLNLPLPSGAQSSRFLMSTIEAGFKQFKLDPSALGAVAVAIGPGSYTGIRIGAAAAKGLAFPRSLPLIGFCSLEGYITSENGPFASLIDAHIGGSYVLLRERHSEVIKNLGSPQLVSKEELEAYLIGYPTTVGPESGYPDSAYLASLVADKLEAGSYGCDLQLLYLRTPVYQKTPSSAS